jgi:hypothetical protein
MESPTCPRCGSSMVLRTARSGRNAGGKFWGCIRYPTCRGTLDHTDNQEAYQDSDINDVFPDYRNQSNRTVPRTIFAAPKKDQLQVQFYQSCGLPESWVKALHHGRVDRGLIQRATQWRLDSPLPKSSGLTRNQQNVISVAQSLLTRGTTPLCLPELEKCVAKEAHAISVSGLESALKELLREPSIPFVPSHFESEEESQF